MNKRSKHPSSSLPLVLIGLGVLMIIGVLAWVASRGAATPSAAAPTSPPGVSQATIPVDQIKRVSLTDAKAAFDGKTALFVDVRDAQSYEGGHVPGAISLPLANLEAGKGLEQLKPSQWIITYCTWPQEESSARAAQYLLANGYTHVTPILGGFKAWEDAGYPIQ